MSTRKRQKYRPEIDGLRAVAIIPVVLFHAGVSGFSGGFVGVDVFFVISGFLITSVIQDDISAGRFSLVQFYERRVRRIFPALFFMLAGCWLLAAWLLYPDDFERFAGSLVAATLFVSSFLFYSESGYFDGAAEEKPLLHTWSLSVEELFYLAYPLTLLVAWRLLGTRWWLLIAALTLASFVGSVIALRLDPHSNAAFYLLQYRAWELLLGAVLALQRRRPQLSPRIGQWLSAAGLVMIVAAVTLYSPETRFPGLAALLPCLGAALVIAFGQAPASGPTALLCWRPVVFVGLISYSLYLWHWPIFVFFDYWAGRPPTRWESGLLIALSIAIAILSWRLIEQPFRGANGLLSRARLFTLAGATMSVLVAIGLHGLLSSGWSSRYGNAVEILAQARLDRDPRQEECLSPSAEAKGCDYGAPAAEPSTVLWGDSHAAVYSAMLGDIGEARGESVRVFTMWSCPPLTGWQIPGQKWLEDCARLQDAAMRAIIDTPSVRNVVLAARFGQVPVLADREGAIRAFDATLDRLLDAGKRAIIVYPVPELPRYGGRDGRLQVVAEDEGTAVVSQPTAEFLRTHEEAFRTLDEFGDRKGLVRVYPHRVLCDQDYCYAARNGVGYYSDQHHLSLQGAALLAPEFEAALGIR
jgi:peptidoglycan/LPS O-acetylase OafA/YrhL